MLSGVKKRQATGISHCSHQLPAKRRETQCDPRTLAEFKLCSPFLVRPHDTAAVPRAPSHSIWCVVLASTLVSKCVPKDSPESQESAQTIQGGELGRHAVSPTDLIYASFVFSASKKRRVDRFSAPKLTDQRVVESTVRNDQQPPAEPFKVIDSISLQTNVISFYFLSHTC